MPDYGQTISKGVKYLQINRLDEDGEDFNQRLALADSIRINHPDIGPVQYNILTTQQQGDSYLMGIIPQEATSSEGRFGFSVTANKNFPTDPTTPNTPYWNGTGPTGKTAFFGMGGSGDAYGFWTVGTDGVSNPSQYEFRRSPNEKVFLQFTCSIFNPSVSTDQDLTIKLRVNGGTIVDLFTLNMPINDGNTGSIEYEIPPEYTIQGTTLSVEGSGGVIGAPLTASFGEFSIIADPIDTPPDVLLNISPEQSNFQWSDYNAVFGNASDPQFSDIFMGVDYSSNYITPINFNLIISGSAPKASVQDSNYTQVGWSNGRYDGSRNSSTDFNQ